MDTENQCRHVVHHKLRGRVPQERVSITANRSLDSHGGQDAVSLEENHRHKVNSHAKYDNRCGVCVKTRSISRHPRRVYSESCDFASVTFKVADESVTVLTGRGPRSECFCPAGDFLVCHERERGIEAPK